MGMDIMEAFMWVHQASSEMDIRPNVARDVTIYHYTSPEGLLGIVGDSKISLRFTRYDCMNDYSEGEEITKVYKNVCNELLAEEKIDESFYRKIIGVMPEKTAMFYYKTESGTAGRMIESDCYICCFSKRQDALPMWNYYVKNNKYQGYNLGLKVGTLRERLRVEEDLNMAYYIGPVIYDEDEKKKCIKRIITEAYETVDSELDVAEVGIARRLRDVRMLFKNSAFAHEEEIRIIIYIPKERPDNCVGRDIEINFRNSQGLIVPYVEMDFLKEVLEEVTIAPLMEMDKAKELVEEWLIRKGYEKVDVQNSRVPIRF